MKEQPIALFLADALENGECFVVDRNGNDVYGWMYEDPTTEAADELRRLHNENQRLREALLSTYLHNFLKKRLSS